jgi:RimJ/RimL family protein N-acetyltransferase
VIPRPGELAGGGVRLRPWRASDAEAIAAIANVASQRLARALGAVPGGEHSETDRAGVERTVVMWRLAAPAPGPL